MTVRPEVTESKVDKNGPTLLVYQDIGSFQVFMADVEQVEGVNVVEEMTKEGDEVLMAQGRLV